MTHQGPKAPARGARAAKEPPTKRAAYDRPHTAPAIVREPRDSRTNALSDAPRNPDLRILGTLARLMARFGKRRLPISQLQLLREMRADGRRMARSTLNRQLLALALAGIVNRRSYRPRWIAGQVKQRVTAYSIGLRGRQWISLWATGAAVPAARPSGVPFLGRIRSTFKLYGVRGKQRAKIRRDNSAPTQPGRGPRSRGGR